ncbi:pentatricopeptide repeat-containing protein At1g05750, chloroplastic [Phragmites australis]|uniref:pentatricopeptide repeat-containing protein At1g05750, chloroplastic n=1 Tax=Phragmites australis TaxID=29695 RepID=UPI002D77E1FB|nr:pentatricopeptide repeat-containing protein At1g05750, chloroplastic [Phragmites australis]
MAVAAAPSLAPPRPPRPAPKPRRARSRPPREREVVSWTSAIARAARQGDLPAAAAALSAMLSSPAAPAPNDVTLLTVLSACADSPSSPLARPLALSLHCLALKLFPSHLLLSTCLARFYLASRLPHLALQLFASMPVRSVVTYNTMIYGLMRNGLVAAAFEVFDGMPGPDKVSWTALIDGCVKNGRHDEAIDCFHAMLLDGVEPDYVTLIAVVSACAEVGALGLGMWVHRFAVRQGLERNVRVDNSMIDMYARCGQVELARQVFDSMRKRTVVSWNSMIVGFAANGRCTEAIEHFEVMRREGFKPDAVTLTGVLTACSHAGLTEQGLRYYGLMTTEYGVAARMEHYGCVVDLLGRAGRLDEAMRVVKAMPMRPNEVVLGALLAGCRMHGDVDMAEQLMQHLLELDPGGDANYVLLSNIYAAVGKWDGAGKVRSLMKARGVKKRPGYSAVEIDGDVHEFVSGDRSHPQAGEIGQMLGLLRYEMARYGHDEHGGSCLDDD